jgi:hypothetical protein
MGDDETITLTVVQLERAMANAAKLGAREALRELGLHDETAATDIRSLRGLLDAWRSARKTAYETTVRVVTTGLLAILAAGLAVGLIRQ